ncbi:MAG: diadenylate cyclase CdaA [Planctomycetota bacterium]
MSLSTQFEQFGRRLDQLWDRVQVIPTWELAVELIVIWLVVFAVLRFLRGTRGERVVKAVALILVVGTLSFRVLAGEDTLERLNFLYGNFIQIMSLVLIIVFQPELRRALVRLGETRLWRQTGLRKQHVIEEIVAATEQLSRFKIGMLVALERQTGLGGLIESGVRLDAVVSQQLLKTIFHPNTPLHDMGVVVREDRLIAAGVQFPLADSAEMPQELGSRHRAAIGLSQETDALILVVSEETGTISVAEKGELTRGLDAGQLQRVLVRGIGRFSPSGPDASSVGMIDSMVSEDTAAGGSQVPRELETGGSKGA